LPALFSIAVYALVSVTGAALLISLIVSWYVYDLSGFYELQWLDDLGRGDGARIVNINAGFDETSGLLAERFTGAEMTALDFYDPARHTEPSIRRARKAYPPFPGTRPVATSDLGLDDGSAHKMFVIMSAHEIREAGERTTFFRQLERGLAPGGQIIVVEHLRDAPNVLAYNIGAFHFHPRTAWLIAFADANLRVDREIKVTPFLTVFILSKHGAKS
jgi:hypothetical protein